MLALLLLLAACSPGGESAAPPATMTTIPVFVYVEPTAAPPVKTAAAATAAAVAAAAGSSAGLDAMAVERGRGRYEALECAACHGDNGEGTDQGSALTTYTAPEDEFISFMRSGGTLGAEHQYATNRLSDSGGRNLYQYLLSIRIQAGE
jgi:mono/diheme cytochrome c family protein